MFFCLFNKRLLYRYVNINVNGIVVKIRKPIFEEYVNIATIETIIINKSIIKLDVKFFIKEHIL